MPIRVSCSALLFAVFFCHSAHAAPLEAYGRRPNLENVRISPDGRTLAFVRSDETSRTVVVQPLDNPSAAGGINLHDAKLRDMAWADSKNLILTTSETMKIRELTGPRQEWSISQNYNLDRRQTKLLLERPDPKLRAMNVVAGVPQVRIIDGRAIAFVEGIYFPQERSRRALFKVDLDSGRVTFVEGGSIYTSWIIDAQGEILFKSDYNEGSQHWTLRLKRDGEWITAIDMIAPIETPLIQGFTDDGGSLVVSLPKNDEREFKQISVKDGSIGPVLRRELGMANVIQDANERIIGVVRYTDKTDYLFYNPQAAHVWKSIVAAYPNEANIELTSWSDDWNKVVFRVFGPNSGDSYYLLDMATKKAIEIGYSYDAIAAADVASVHWIGYPASDGREIGAYLTVPKNRGLKNLPLIVLPHGGPAVRDMPGFDWWSQALASRGYVVLQPQYRGSDGFGWEQLAAGFGQWGRKMQTDLSDGVRALAAKGLIDPKRVCIVGASYGGYAALAGATLDTGIYRCAVSVAGISDLQSFVRWRQSRDRRSDSRTVRYWNRFMGADDSGSDTLQTISPIKHIGKVMIPVLLIHGHDDTVVPIAQSEDMVDALRRAGKPVEYVKLQGEDHWLSRSETRLQMLSATVNFLEKHNPAQ